MGQSLGRSRAVSHCLALGRYRSGRAAAGYPRSRTAGDAARRRDGDHVRHRDAGDHHILSTPAIEKKLALLTEQGADVSTAWTNSRDCDAMSGAMRGYFLRDTSAISTCRSPSRFARRSNASNGCGITFGTIPDDQDLETSVVTSLGREIYRACVHRE